MILNTISNKWALDNAIVIVENKLVQRGVAGIPDIFTHDFMYGSLGKKLDAVSGGRYRPLTPTIYAVFSEILGKPMLNEKGEIVKDAKGHPLNDLSESTTFPNIMHLLNIILYGVLCYVLYHFLLLIFVNIKNGQLYAFIATFIFTLHPLHTEVVANVRGSDEILALLFSISSALFFFKYINHQAQKQYCLVVLGCLCFFLGLLAKENTIMFIVIIPLTI